ncbi:DMT family transporter [Idiomarina sp.]|uniref:DMT family transporter n=1 Tax=Idiomarina sp. TaxID=1874361 RepID=UPI003A8F633F
MTLLMIIIAIVGGAALSIQAAVNGELGSKVGVFKSAFLTFLLGAIITGLLIFYFEPSYAMTLADVPKWQLLGALCGVPYIVIMVLAVQKIGTAVATVAVIFGQLAMSVLIDTLGWFDNSEVTLSASRIGAVLCLGVALFFIHSSIKNEKKQLA